MRLLFGRLDILVFGIIEFGSFYLVLFCFRVPWLKGLFVGGNCLASARIMSARRGIFLDFSSAVISFLRGSGLVFF